VTDERLNDFGLDRALPMVAKLTPQERRRAAQLLPLISSSPHRFFAADRATVLRGINGRPARRATAALAVISTTQRTEPVPYTYDVFFSNHA
jgi:hypothetical protein